MINSTFEYQISCLLILDSLIHSYLSSSLLYYSILFSFPPFHPLLYFFLHLLLFLLISDLFYPFLHFHFFHTSRPFLPLFPSLSLSHFSQSPFLSHSFSSPSPFLSLSLSRPPILIYPLYSPFLLLIPFFLISPPLLLLSFCSPSFLPIQLDIIQLSLLEGKRYNFSSLVSPSKKIRVFSTFSMTISFSALRTTRTILGIFYYS